MFVDASALCTVLLQEPGCEELERKLATASGAITSPIAIWETVRGVMRETGADVDSVRREVEAYLAQAGVGLVTIGEAELDLALEVYGRFGKGRHPAKLNMGDCFAYACAKARRTPLLFKGDDFALTDIPAA